MPFVPSQRAGLLVAVFLLSACACANSPIPTPKMVFAPDTILGVRPGADRDDIHDILKPLGTTRSSADEDAKGKAVTSGDNDDEGGHTELWAMRGTPYAQVVFKADAVDHVLWVTGFLRSGQEIPFGRFGDPKNALVYRDSLAVWNILPAVKSTLPPYRLIARGMKGQARSVSLISLAPPKTH